MFRPQRLVMSCAVTRTVELLCDEADDRENADAYGCVQGVPGLLCTYSTARVMYPQVANSHLSVSLHSCALPARTYRQKRQQCRTIAKWLPA